MEASPTTTEARSTAIATSEYVGRTSVKRPAPAKRARRECTHAADAGAAVDNADGYAGDENERFGGGDKEAVAAAEDAKGGISAEVIDRHGEDGEPAEEVNPQVTVPCNRIAPTAPKIAVHVGRPALKGPKATSPEVATRVGA